MNELENQIDAAMERDIHEETRRERFRDCLCCAVKIPDSYLFCGHCADAVENIVIGLKVIFRRFRP